MEFVNWLWNYVFVPLVVLTVLVFIHELGHYAVARYHRVRIEVFSVGFGSEIFGWTDRVGTRWKISAVPLGGYVKMFGEKDAVGWGEDERAMTPEEQAVSFHHKRLGQRAAIVAAGPLANFLFAIVVLAGLFASVGTPAPLAGVGSVPDGTAAAMAGLRPGDRIVAIDGSPVRWFEELRGIVGAAPNVPLKLEVLRQNEQLFVTVTPQTVEIVDADGVPRTIGRLGVTPDAAQIGYERHNLLKAAWLGVEYTVNLCWKILSYIGQMIGGKQSADQLGGPLRIAQVLGDVAQGQGGVIGLIFTAVALSVNLGLINLFPVPMLDGGHLVFYAFEALRGRPLSERVQEYGFRIGVTLVLFLMVFATWNDLIQPRFIEFFRQFIT